MPRISAHFFDYGLPLFGVAEKVRLHLFLIEAIAFHQDLKAILD